MRILDVILKEVRLTLDKGGNFIINRNDFTTKTDPFFINRSKESFKISGVPVYTGIYPNPDLNYTSDQLISLYNGLKKNEKHK